MRDPFSRNVTMQFDAREPLSSLRTNCARVLILFERVTAVNREIRYLEQQIHQVKRLDKNMSRNERQKYVPERRSLIVGYKKDLSRYKKRIAFYFPALKRQVDAYDDKYQTKDARRIFGSVFAGRNKSLV